MKFLSHLTTFALVAGFFTDVAFAQKDAMLTSVVKQEPQAWAIAQQIWTWAEPGYQEKQSSELLAKHLEAAGFTLQKGVAEIPTAFTATFGSGKPVIGILGEYDALPGLSQDAVPYRKSVTNGGYGHACGHHLFGAASATAAIAIAEQIKAGKIKGTVRFYGCPAEEGGSAKTFLVMAGLFQDVDAVLHWHPSSSNSSGERSCLARIAARFRFQGKAAHAAGAPDQGRSALDAVELTTFASQLMREHMPDQSRMHHVITNGGGGAPNVVPEQAEVYYYVRHPKGEVVRQLYQRLLLCAQAGALGTETRLEARQEGGTRELLPNTALSAVMTKNLKELVDLQYTPEETEFAIRLRETIPKPEPLEKIRQVDDRVGGVGMGSTDVGDVSWVVPTAGFSTACWVPGTPGHSWQAVACGGTGIARKGMMLAARVLAASAWDLFTNPEAINEAKTEQARRLGEQKYFTLMEPGAKPPLEYRKSSRAE
ncbi:MAG: amidohydrolase [Planctomycetaceae bacterium]|nr:amidohydrolase [Planctomycetaceae bacterium]